MLRTGQIVWVWALFHICPVKTAEVPIFGQNLFLLLMNVFKCFCEKNKEVDFNDE